MAAFISKFQVKCCSKWGGITMDDAQCGENTKAWGYATIVKGSKKNLKWWANINRKSGY